jgi:drug/metabolite transporter (DMT)-like permease
MIFALVSAVLYGTADFLGGAAARRTAVLGILLISTPFGALIIFAAALVGGGPGPVPVDLAWGAASGVAGGLGLVVFYAGLAAGPMSVVAPVSALFATLLPVVVALMGGEHPHPAVLAGVAACLAAIVLVSWDSGGGERVAGGSSPGAAHLGLTRMLPAGPGLLYGVAAGAAFGLFFVLVRNATHAGVIWPLAASRGTGTLVVAAAAACAGKRPLGWSRDRVAVVMALCAGAFDASANVSYVLAISSGMFSVAVVLTSLYPTITVVLARMVLGERMRRRQRAGLVLAAVGVVLVTAM